MPVLSDAFPGVRVHATPPTNDIVSILLRDALKLMDSPERDGDMPLYAAPQLARLMEALTPVHHEQPVDIGDVRVTFLPASHILGASMVHLSTPEGDVLFTGDYSVSAQLAVPALTRPSLPVDMVVTESTYGARLHEEGPRAAGDRIVDRFIHIAKATGTEPACPPPVECDGEGDGDGDEDDDEDGTWGRGCDRGSGVSSSSSGSDGCVIGARGSGGALVMLAVALGLYAGRRRRLR